VGAACVIAVRVLCFFFLCFCVLTFVISSEHDFGDSVISDRFASKGSQIISVYCSFGLNPRRGGEIEAFGRIVVIYTLDTHP